MRQALTFEIRPVTPDDVPEVLALVRDVLAEFGLEFGSGCHTDTELEALPGWYTGAGGAFWVVERDGRLCGTCGVIPVGPGEFELRKMYLRGETRGHGLGQRLLDRALGFARGAGASRMVLDTVDEMTAAIAFYEANGFVRDDAQVRAPRCTRGYSRAL